MVTVDLWSRLQECHLLLEYCSTRYYYSAISTLSFDVVILSILLTEFLK